jgi:hypothetical protein
VTLDAGADVGGAAFWMGSTVGTADSVNGPGAGGTTIDVAGSAAVCVGAWLGADGWLGADSWLAAGARIGWVAAVGAAVGGGRAVGT